MSGSGKPMLNKDLACERQLRILAHASHACLAGIALCVAFVALSPFVPRRIGIELEGFAILAAVALLFLSMLLRFWRASRLLTAETSEARTNGFAIVDKAEEIRRQWAWATALCRLSRGASAIARRRDT